jgi:hypothetical protein
MLQEAAMAEDIVGSNMSDFPSDALKEGADHTKTGYGQNGYAGASSDTDLSNPTRSAMSVELFGLHPTIVRAPQTRTVGDNVADAYGMDQARVRQPNARKTGI